jgi:hypothetical protein
MKFNLEKSIAQAKFTIAKKGMSNVKAAVVLNLDVSGSAKGMYERGLIQDFLNLIVPIASQFDDNASLQVFTFASGDEYTSEISPDVTTDNYDGYVKKYILDNRNVKKWGGTDYTPVLKSNLDALGFYKQAKGGLFSFGKSSPVLSHDNGSGYPALIVIGTDGENYDQENAIKFLRECEAAGTQAYFMFIGIGNANFSNIIELGDMFPNCGFLNVKNLEKFIGSDDIYDQLLCDELIQWFKK